MTPAFVRRSYCYRKNEVEFRARDDTMMLYYIHDDLLKRQLPVRDP